jgi:hypothetical protein
MKISMYEQFRNFQTISWWRVGTTALKCALHLRAGKGQKVGWLINTSHLKIFALLGCYTGYISSYLPTFQDNLSVPSWTVWPSKMELTSSPKMAVFNYQAMLHNINTFTPPI